jgi:hypothetical protein
VIIGFLWWIYCGHKSCALLGEKIEEYWQNLDLNGLPWSQKPVTATHNLNWQKINKIIQQNQQKSTPRLYRVLKMRQSHSWGKKANASLMC